MIIAEFSNNWIGDKELLWKMVRVASEQGAKFCKIQTFFADERLSVNALCAGRGC